MCDFSTNSDTIDKHWDAHLSLYLLHTSCLVLCLTEIVAYICSSDAIISGFAADLQESSNLSYIAPVLVFCVFVARKLMNEFEEHWGISYIIKTRDFVSLFLISVFLELVIGRIRSGRHMDEDPAVGNPVYFDCGDPDILGSFYTWTCTYQMIQASALKYNALKVTDKLSHDANKDLNANENTHLLNKEDDVHINTIMPSTSLTSQDTENQCIVHQKLDGSVKKKHGSISDKLVKILKKIVEQLLAPPTLGSGLRATVGVVFVNKLSRGITFAPIGLTELFNSGGAIVEINYEMEKQ
ncbi:hypothetical protein L2E82_18873 [Cichorium intybus]|uniref:Uncharacterized protein n=1 Tax=Cichorium intybus TaxID=13427 RepID=A0ACB9FBS5_CICIN|nr:hypothetical protein L2E82_18873 [Cichorium intybus]